MSTKTMGIMNVTAVLRQQHTIVAALLLAAGRTACGPAFLAVSPGSPPVD